MKAGWLAIAALALSGPAWAADITVEGHVEHVLHLTAADLKAMPQTGVDAHFMSGHGAESGHYAGPLLWDVLAKAAVTDQPGSISKHHLQHAVLVTGEDGYTVALALGELDTEFEGKSVILADSGAAGIRLIVPGDKRGGRNVRNVVKIKVE